MKLLEIIRVEENNLVSKECKMCFVKRKKIILS